MEGGASGVAMVTPTQEVPVILHEQIYIMEDNTVWLGPASLHGLRKASIHQGCFVEHHRISLEKRGTHSEHVLSHP